MRQIEGTPISVRIRWMSFWIGFQQCVAALSVLWRRRCRARSPHSTRLQSLQGLYRCDFEKYALVDVAPVFAVGRVRVEPSDAAGTADEWSIGMIRGSDGYFRYRLRGAQVIDAYGTEIILCNGKSGGLHVLSAGPDGRFAVDPGDDGAFSSSDCARLLADDRNGADDNIAIGSEAK